MLGGMKFSKVQKYAPFETRRSEAEQHRFYGGLGMSRYYTDIKVVGEQYVKQSYLPAYREYVAKLDGKPVKPTVEYTDIKGSLPYDESGNSDPANYNVFNWFLRSEKGIHQGQRKLALSEIQSLNEHFDYDEEGIVIYAGAAPSMKLQIMMKMFPKVKFLLVDPNEFFIYVYRYDLPHYVFQDDNYVKRGDKWGCPTDQTERANEVQDFIYLSVSASNMYESKFYKNKNVLYYDTKSGKLVKMKKPISNSGYGESRRNISGHSGEYALLTERANIDSIKYFFESDHRVAFIEEYFTNNIAEMVGRVSEMYPIKTVFWSDIRTNMKMTEKVNEMDVILNTAWMYSWLRLMKPTATMLKWRLPFLNESSDPDFSEFKESFDDAAEKGYDFRLPTWKDGKFVFFPGRIMLQAWCGPISTETRLIVKKEDIVNNNLTEYSIPEYESTLNWYNNVDRFSVIHENDHASKEIGFCHCNDCAIENTIWSNYCKKNPTANVNELINRLSNMLHINLIDRGRRFGHGHLFPDLTIDQFVKNVTESTYPPVTRL